MSAAHPSDTDTPMEKPGFVARLKADLPASFVVFLIAIPLSLGIALASGAPIMAGLIAGVIGGIIAGSFGGAPLQVSGPAAGLTVMVFGLVSQFGWQTTCFITLCAGLVQIALGLLKIARASLAISPAVVHGMLAGIGVVIALAQLHVVLGGKPESSALKNLQELPGQIGDLHGPSTILGLITIAILFGWNYVPKKLKSIPPSLVAVVVATLISLPMNLPENLRVNLPDSLVSGHQWPTLPSGNWGAILVAIFSIAMVASVESLLSAVAVDKLHGGQRANLDRELIGQGAANTVSGLLGGLPVTGVIVRSSANVNAGAKSNLSAIMHGVWILLFVVFLSSMLERIPLSVLAGLLVFVGLRLVSPDHIKEMLQHREWPIYFVTLLGVVFTNLLEGVAIGFGLAIILLLRRLAMIKVEVTEGNERWHVVIRGSMTFLSVPQLTAKLAEIPAGMPVDVDLMADFMDHAAFEALHSWRMSQERTGGKVDIDELHEAWYENAEHGVPLKEKTAVVTGNEESRRKARKTTEAAAAL